MTFPSLPSAPRPAGSTLGVIAGMPLLATGGAPAVMPAGMPLAPLAFEQLMQVSTRRPAQTANAITSTLSPQSYQVATVPLPTADEPEAISPLDEDESEAPAHPAKKNAEESADGAWVAVEPPTLPAPQPRVVKNESASRDTGERVVAMTDELTAPLNCGNERVSAPSTENEHATPASSSRAEPVPVAPASSFAPATRAFTPDRAPAPTAVQNETVNPSMSSTPQSQPASKPPEVERTASTVNETSTPPLPVTASAVSLPIRSVQDSAAAVAGTTFAPVINPRPKTRAAEFAVAPRRASERSDNVIQPEEKNFLSVGDNAVKKPLEVAGIATAKQGADMTAHAFTEKISFEEPATGIHSASSFDGNASDFETIQSRSSGDVASAARTAVSTVLKLVENQAAARAHESPVVNLNLRLADDDLAIRVEWRDGAVHAEFRTESSGLRAALSQEWSGMVADATPRGLRFADAQISGANQSSADLSQGGGQPGREQAFARSHAETAAPASSPRLMRAPAAPEPAPVAAWSPLPSAHLSTFA